MSDENLRSLVARVVVIAVAAGGLAACKVSQSSQGGDESRAKDFTYSDSVKNYAVVAGFNPENPDGVKTDVLNWKNMLSRGQLGTFEIVYASDNASGAEVKAAFQKIGTQLDPNATVLFAFSGRSSGANLRASDGLFTFADAAGQMAAAAKAIGKTGGHRLYVFNDSSPVDANLRTGASADHNRYALSEGFAALKDSPMFFPEVMEMGASSNDLTSQNGAITYAGRFTYEFIRLLDLYVGANGKALTGGVDADPTLQAFFLDVAKATQGSAFGPATFIVHPDSLLTEKMFSPGVLQAKREAQAVSPAVTPTPPTPVAPAGPGGGATNLAASLTLPLKSSSSQTDLKNLFKGNVMLLEISVDWCGPCANLAQDIANDQAIKQLEAGGKCSHATILNSDGNDLSAWNSATNNLAVDHSYAYAGSDSLDASFLSKLTGQSVSIQFYPTVFAVKSTGEVINVGADSAVDAYKQACK